MSEDNKADSKVPPLKKCRVEIKDNNADHSLMDSNTDVVPNEESDQPEDDDIASKSSPQLEDVNHKTPTTSISRPKARMLTDPL
jgi:hypothetical protein